MRSIWNGLAIFCFLNVVAILVGVGLLAQTGRLSKARVQDAWDLFVESPADRELRLTADEQAAAEAADDAEATGESDTPLVGAAEQFELRLRYSDAEQQRILRLRREVDDLRASLARDRQLLERERDEFRTERDAFEAYRDEIAEVEGSVQFRKALSVLETIKAAEGVKVLLELTGTGRDMEAVGYLDAMEDRTRAKLIAELTKSDEVELATQLLESLRTRGIEPAADGAEAE